MNSSSLLLYHTIHTFQRVSHFKYYTTHAGMKTSVCVASSWKIWIISINQKWQKIWLLSLSESGKNVLYVS